MTYKNKIFEQIKYKNSCIERLIYKMKSDKRQFQWKKQRAKYGGWDERVTWSLDQFMTENIYTWLSMYLKFASDAVDLDYQKFSIDGKKLSEKECIVQILKDIKFFLKHRDDLDLEIEKKAQQKIARAYHYIGIVLPSLWW